MPFVSVFSQIHPVHVFISHWRSILILSSHLYLDFPSGLLLAGFPTKTLYSYLFFSIYGHFGVLTSSSLISSSRWYLVTSTYHDASHYTVFSTPLSFPSCQSQISPSAPFPETPSACVLPLLWGTRFRTHIRQLAKPYLENCCFCSVYALCTVRMTQSSHMLGTSACHFIILSVLFGASSFGGLYLLTKFWNFPLNPACWQTELNQTA